MDIKKQGIKWGLIVGGATVAIYIIAYMVRKESYIDSTMIWLLTMMLYLIGMRQASVETRTEFLSFYNENGEPYRFAYALQPPFLVFLIAQVLYYLQQYLMFNFIDPSLSEIARDIAIEKIDEVSGILGRFMDEDNADLMREQLEEQDFSMKISSVLLNLAFSLLGGFLISCIYALVFKKENV